MKAFAADMKLDTKAFNSCFDSGKYTQLVADQTNFARSLGVPSTPTFLINGKPIVGAQSYETFKQTIDSFLTP